RFLAYPAPPLMFLENRSKKADQRHGREDLPLNFLNSRAVDDDDISRINLRVRGLAAANGREVECRGLPLSTDRSENRHAPGIRVLASSPGERNRLNQAHRARDRILARLVDCSVNGDD